MKIKLTESKKLEFNMDTVGCSWEDLKGHLRFTFENVEYGFPAEIKDGKLVVNVPPFQSVISEGLNESISKNKQVIVKGRLDVIANENSYVMPWSGDVEIEVPVAVRVKSNKDLQDMLEAAKDIKVTDTKITTVSTAEKNPEPGNSQKKSLPPGGPAPDDGWHGGSSPTHRRRESRRGRARCRP